jgi:LysM repeat protein
MKRISFFLMAALLAVPMISSAQDAATEERFNKLSAQIEDLIDMKNVQNKKIEALEKQVNELQGKLNTPQGNYASADDLKQVADAVEKVDKNRKADNERVLNELEKLGKTLSPGGGSGSRRPAPVTDSKPPIDLSKPHMEHKVESGETVEAIAKAYRDKGIKITADQILAANPGLQPKNMKVGQTIVIPAPGK